MEKSTIPKVFQYSTTRIKVIKILILLLLSYAIFCYVVTDRGSLREISTFLTLYFAILLGDKSFKRSPFSYIFKELFLMYAYLWICAFIWFNSPLNFIFFCITVASFLLHWDLIKKRRINNTMPIKVFKEKFAKRYCQYILLFFGVMFIVVFVTFLLKLRQG
jgi:hypothetical protein